MKNISNLGRILFGISLLIFAVNPLMHATQTAAAIPLPMAQPLAYISGIVLLAGGLSIIFNKSVHITMFLISILLLLRACTVHYPNFSEGDSEIFMAEVMNMAKDFGLAGAALFMSGLSWPGKS